MPWGPPPGQPHTDRTRTSSNWPSRRWSWCSSPARFLLEYPTPGKTRAQPPPAAIDGRGAGGTLGAYRPRIARCPALPGRRAEERVEWLRKSIQAEVHSENRRSRGQMSRNSTSSRWILGPPTSTPARSNRPPANWRSDSTLPLRACSPGLEVACLRRARRFDTWPACRNQGPSSGRYCGLKPATAFSISSGSPHSLAHSRVDRFQNQSMRSSSRKWRQRARLSTNRATQCRARASAWCARKYARSSEGRTDNRLSPTSGWLKCSALFRIMYSFLRATWACSPTNALHLFLKSRPPNAFATPSETTRTNWWIRSRSEEHTSEL